jgi:hypothetical protein
LVPKDERDDFKKPEFLKKVSTLEPLQYLPKVQARRFRLQQLTFETDTPTVVKEKIRVAVPTGGNIVLYKSLAEFEAAFPHSANLKWIEQELLSLPDKPESAVIFPLQVSSHD